MLHVFRMRFACGTANFRKTVRFLVASRAEASKLEANIRKVSFYAESPICKDIHM